MIYARKLYFVKRQQTKESAHDKTLSAEFTSTLSNQILLVKLLGIRDSKFLKKSIKVISEQANSFGTGKAPEKPYCQLAQNYLIA
jgi:hypothetical protein